MSGGSHDYAYSRVESFAASMRRSHDPLRRALAAHLDLVAKAMHDIEWVDSNDAAPGDEHEAIRAVLGADAAQMAEIAAELRRLIAEAEELLSRQSTPPATVTETKTSTHQE